MAEHVIDTVNAHSSSLFTEYFGEAPTDKSSAKATIARCQLQIHMCKQLQVSEAETKKRKKEEKTEEFQQKRLHTSNELVRIAEEKRLAKQKADKATSRAVPKKARH